MSSAHALRQIVLAVLVRARSALVLSSRALSARHEERGDERGRRIGKEDHRLSLLPLHAGKAWNCDRSSWACPAGDEECMQRHEGFYMRHYDGDHGQCESSIRGNLMCRWLVANTMCWVWPGVALRDAAHESKGATRTGGAGLVCLSFYSYLPRASRYVLSDCNFDAMPRNISEGREAAY